MFGDIQDFETMKEAVIQSESVIHLAAIIPPLSKKNRELKMNVNYQSVINLIKAINETIRKTLLLFSSHSRV
jgi:nucleoside-diphosphate-sugar epimerase